MLSAGETTGIRPVNYNKCSINLVSQFFGMPLWTNVAQLRTSWLDDHKVSKKVSVVYVNVLSMVLATEIKHASAVTVS